MDAFHFDHLTRTVSTVLSRRTAASVLGLGALALPGLADARKKRKHKKKKITRNAFGCVNVDGFCKNDRQCCSGICQGRKDKKTCKDHDQSTCQAGQNTLVCDGDANVLCTATDGTAGLCHTTTGQGAFCSAISACFVCATDADCRRYCDRPAACTVCPGCVGSGTGNVGTGCAWVDVSGCT